MGEYIWFHVENKNDEYSVSKSINSGGATENRKVVGCRAENEEYSVRKSIILGGGTERQED